MHGHSRLALSRYRFCSNKEGISENAQDCFRGPEKSDLRYNSEMKTWEFSSLKESRFVGTFTDSPTERFHPFGRRLLVSYDLIPNISSGKTDGLTVVFSRCARGQYTCSSGHCIDIRAKCDSVMDCQDGSDEDNCPVLTIPDTYKHRATPKGNPLKVYVSAVLQSFPVIDTVALTFSVNYYLSLRWYDDRLTLRDLNRDSTLNSLSHKERVKIWRPHLAFDNALGTEQFAVDDTTRIFALSEVEGEEVTINGEETLLYPGKNDSIVMSREFYHTYTCKFHLYFYPFDTQHCVMNMTGLDVRADRMQFQVDDLGILEVSWWDKPRL